MITKEVGRELEEARIKELFNKRWTSKVSFCRIGEAQALVIDMSDGSQIQILPGLFSDLHCAIKLPDAREEIEK